MTLANCIAIASIFTGPLIAILISIWYQNRKEKREAKLNLFFTLVALRGQVPIPYQFVSALNQIDVIFYKADSVVTAWKDYYESLNPMHSEHANNGKRFLDLLHEMGKNLGYKDLKQTTLDKSYIPQGHANAQATQQQILNELHRVLANSETFGLNIQAPKDKDQLEE